MPDKPLHVQVAEALERETGGDHEWDEAPNGHRGCVRCGLHWEWNKDCHEPCVPHYDTDWSTTGPLIEKYQIDLTHEILSPPGDQRVVASTHRANWYEETDGSDTGDLIAVCNLILKLAEEGKLYA